METVGEVRAVAVIHAYPPDTPEWDARMRRAVNVYRYEERAQRIIVTGGRNGLKGYNNPARMKSYLRTNGVPEDHIVWQDIQDKEVFTSANTVDTPDEVRYALARICENGWEDCVIYPISNEIHIRRVMALYRYWAKERSMKLNLQPMPTPNKLGWKWALMEILLLRLYTLFDPGWTGWLAERMRRSRRGTPEESPTEQ